MTKSDTNDFFSAFRDIITGILKSHKTEGRRLTSDSLASGLYENKDFKSLLADNPDFFQSQKLEVVEETETLQQTLKKETEEKQKALRRLQESEFFIQQCDEFYSRVLFFFINILRTDEDQPFSEQLRQFENAIQNKDKLEVLEDRFGHLKDAVLKADVAPMTSPAKAAATEAADARDEPAETADNRIVKQLQGAYLELVYELGVNLEAEQLQQLKKIAKQIKRAKTMDDLQAARRGLFAFVQTYVSGISSERDEAAMYVREIGQRLADVEESLLQSLALSRDGYAENDDFNRVLADEFVQLRRTIDSSQSLEELKASAISALKTLKEILDRKKAADTQKKDALEEKIRDFETKLGHMQSEISDMQQYASFLEEQSEVEPLTGIYNRRAYDKRLKKLWKEFNRQQTPFSLVLVDVDRFKEINDKYGHAIGDQCLMELIHRIKDNLRQTDFFARYGGDEFVLLLPGTPLDKAEKFAEKVCNVVSRIDFIYKKETVVMTISVGVGQVRKSDKNPTDLFERVDNALYDAKRGGRNQVVKA